MGLNPSTKAQLIREIAEADRDIARADRYLANHRKLVEAANAGADDDGAPSSFLSSLSDLCDAIAKAKSEAANYDASEEDQSALTSVFDMLPELQEIELRLAGEASDVDDDGTIAVTESAQPRRINLREINFNRHWVPAIDARGMKFTKDESPRKINLKDVSFKGRP